MLGISFCIFFLVAGLVVGEQELRLVHVLFVHPTKYSFPAYLAVANAVEDLPEKDLAAKMAIAEVITKEDKLVTYNLGVRLRQKYDDFLGSLYTWRITRVRTTDVDVSIMASELVNAGLWPPSKEQQWLKDFHWQPVPIEYVDRNEDTLMMGRLCPNFVKTTNVMRNSADYLEMEEKHRELFSRISKETGLGMSSSQDIAYLYKSLKARHLNSTAIFHAMVRSNLSESINPDNAATRIGIPTIIAQKFTVCFFKTHILDNCGQDIFVIIDPIGMKVEHELIEIVRMASRNLTLPSWTDGIFPNGEMLNVTYLEDEILSKTTLQRKLNGGYLIQKIFLDSMAHINGLLDNERKIMIYSGDSDLLIGVMHSLGVWHPHVPNVASALIFELLHDPVTQSYKMKISYDLGKDNVTIPLKIPGCAERRNSAGCQFENLVLLLAEILPGSDETLCGQTVTEIFFREEQRLSVEMNLNTAAKSSIGVFAIFCFTILTIVI